MKSSRNISIARIATVPFAIVTQLKPQLQYLVDSGVDVHVITSEGCELERLVWGEHLVLHKLHIARKPSVISDVVSLFRLFVLLRKFKFKIVHSTTPKAGLLTAIAGFFAGGDFNRRLRRPRVRNHQHAILRGPGDYGYRKSRDRRNQGGVVQGRGGQGTVAG